MRNCVIGKFPPIQGGVRMRTYWRAHGLAAHGHEVRDQRPFHRGLASQRGRIEFAFATDGSVRFPLLPHPTSRRRSSGWLQAGVGLLKRTCTSLNRTRSRAHGGRDRLGHDPVEAADDSDRDALANPYCGTFSFVTVRPRMS